MGKIQSDSSRSVERNNEIVAFFYMIFGRRVHKGMDAEDARKEAYDAVTLRYGIGKGRLLNIISEQRVARPLNQALFRENALALMHELQLMNEGLDAARGKNDKLISLLEECINGND